jgi:hypothetical protein
MLKNLQEKTLQLSAEIEAVYSEYQRQSEDLFNNRDITAEAKKRQEWELYEKARAKAAELSKQGLGEVAEMENLLTRQLVLVQKKADSETDPGKRAQIENLKEELEAELIAAGPFEYLKTLAKLTEAEASPSRLEAARAILPKVKASLYEEFYTRETGGQVLNPWGESESAIRPENNEMIKAELQQTARKLADALKPEPVKKVEADIAGTGEVKAELNSAYTRTIRLLEKVKPAGAEPGSLWDPAEMTKPQEAII